MSKDKILCYAYDMDRHTDAEQNIETLLCLGDPGEDIRIRSIRTRFLQEPLRTREYFLFYYTLQGSFCAEVQQPGHLLRIREGDFCTAQPGSALALHIDSPGEDVILAEICIRKESFLRDMLPYFTFDGRIFRFFLEPADNMAADDYVLQAMGDSELPRSILDRMLQEAAAGGEGSQSLLKAMLLQLLLLASRAWLQNTPPPENTSLAGQILHYIEIHPDTVTLKELSAQFHYHPNYVSALVHQASGRSFSRLVLERRMAQAELLLKHPELSVEEVAALTGYAGASGFYKAYKAFFGKLPRK